MKGQKDQCKAFCKAENRMLRPSDADTARVANRRFRSCGCCHVKTAALILGMYKFTLQMFAMCLLVFVVFEPSLMFGYGDRSLASDVGLDRLGDDGSSNIKSANYPLEQLPTPVPQGFQWDSVDGNRIFILRGDILGATRRHLMDCDLSLAIAFVLGMMFITSMMIYGVLKSRPFYLIPFFCFQIFDFTVCLTAIGQYTWMPAVDKATDNSLTVPLDDQATVINAQWLALVVFLLYVIALPIKVYFIGIIWSCYQYLKLVNKERYLVDYPDVEKEKHIPSDVAANNYDTPPPPYPAAQA